MEPGTACIIRLRFLNASWVPISLESVDVMCDVSVTEMLDTVVSLDWSYFSPLGGVIEIDASAVVADGEVVAMISG